MPPLDREFHARREDEPLDEPAAIEFRLGFDRPAEAFEAKIWVDYYRGVPHTAYQRSERR
jgi:hypothetical protein